jgi:hypothetical protein
MVASLYNINVKRKSKENSTKRFYMPCIREKDNTYNEKSRQRPNIHSPRNKTKRQAHLMLENLYQNKTKK